MLCSKCGKQIDDGSKFCPFCGNTIKADSVQKDANGSDSNMRGNVQSAAAEKQKAKKPAPTKLIACGAAVAVLTIVSIFIFRSSGGGQIEKSFLGKMFSLSCSEISDMTARDVRNLLKEEDIRYKYMEEEEHDVLYWSVMTEETSKFMGSDAIYLGFSNSFIYRQHFCMLYETRDDCKDSYEDIKNYLDRNLVKNTTGIDLMEAAPTQFNLSEMGIVDFSSAYYEGPLKLRERTMYLMEECTDDEVLDQYLDRVVQIAMQNGNEVPDSESIAEARKELEGYGIYKVVDLYYGTVDSISGFFEMFEDVFEELDLSLNDASYSNSICIAEIGYILADKNGFTSIFAMYGWDSLSGKEIDIETAKSSLDAGLQAVVGKETGGDEVAETVAYSALYMMDKYNYDVFEGRYIDKEDRNFWYIDHFKYDMDRGEEVELSDYGNSAEVYCAVEYNYNIDKAVHFESDLDRGLYLVNRGYNLETGGTFSSNDEKRLWVMANYGYDIVAEKAVDKEIGEVLLTYQKYVDENMNDMVDEWTGYSLVYINDDEVPECLVWTNPYLYNNGTEVAGYMYLSILSYVNEAVQVYNSCGVSGCETNFMYNPNGGVFCIDEILGLRDAEKWSVAELTSEFKEIGYADVDTVFGFEDGQYHTYTRVNPAGADPFFDISIDEYLNSFGLKIKLDEESAAMSVMEAYDALRTVEYYVNMPEIGEFILTDGVLTVSTNDGSKYNWIASNPCSFSYPVADDCVWVYGWYEEDFVKYKDYSYEELKQMITSEFEWYESIYKEDGKEWFEQYGIESPLSIQVIVTDGIVVEVRVISP